MSKKGKTPPVKGKQKESTPERQRQGGHPDYSVTKTGRGKRSGGSGGSSSSYADLGLLDHFGNKVYIRAKLKKRAQRS